MTGGTLGLAMFGSMLLLMALRVPIAAAYPLVQAARAHQRIERGHVIGRIALRIRRD